MNVQKIKDGLVIDHIRAGTGIRIFNWLKLDKVPFSVALIMNVPSGHLGKKDIIKIDNVIDVDYSVLGFIDPDITVNVVEEEHVVRKISLTLPERVENVIKCRNPRCITSSETTIPHVFQLVDRKRAEYAASTATNSTAPESEISVSEPLLFINARLVDCDTDTSGALLVRDGKIAAVYHDLHPAQVEHPEARVIDCGGATLMPAFVDMHAHFRDPGFTYKEDLESGSRAAAAGGFATVVLMPNTNPVISDRAASLAVRARASGAEFPDIFQSVSLTRGFGGTDTSALADLDPSETPIATEDGHEVASAAVMLDAMRICAKTGVLVCCHCEDPSLAERARELRTAALADPGNSATLYTKAERILRLAEVTLTYRYLALAEEAGCRVHIDHLSTIRSLAEYAPRSSGEVV